MHRGPCKVKRLGQHKALTRLTQALFMAAGIDIMRSVIASNLPMSFYPTLSPSDPEMDGSSVEVLPSLQVGALKPSGLPPVLQCCHPGKQLQCFNQFGSMPPYRTGCIVAPAFDASQSPYNCCLSDSFAQHSTPIACILPQLLHHPEPLASDIQFGQNRLTDGTPMACLPSGLASACF